MIFIGEKIREVWRSSGMTVTEFAKRINTSRENVYGIFKRKTIDTGLLYQIGYVLNYNFFLDYCTEEESNVLQDPPVIYGSIINQKNQELLKYILENLKQHDRILKKIDDKLSLKEKTKVCSN